MNKKGHLGHMTFQISKGLLECPLAESIYL